MARRMQYPDHNIQLETIHEARELGSNTPLGAVRRQRSDSPPQQDQEAQAPVDGNSSSEFGQSILEQVVDSDSGNDNPPPDGGWRAWCVVLSCHLVYMNTWGWTNSFGIFQAYYAEVLSRPASDISWIGSISVFLLFFVGALTGRLVDAGYFRWVFGVGIILQVMGIMLTSVCTKYWQYFALQGVVVGLGHGCIFCPTLAVLSTYFAKRRALAMGVAACGSGTGGMLFVGLVRTLLPKEGFEWTLRIAGFIQLGLLTIALILTKPRIRPRRSGPLIDFFVFKDIEYSMYVVATFFTCMAVYIPYYFVPAYSRTALNPPFIFTESLDLSMILNGVGIVGRLLANWTADHAGIINVFAPNTLAASILLYFWMMVSGKPGLYTWSVVYGILGASIQSLFPTGVSLLTEDLSQIGVRMGMAFSVASLSVLMGPPTAAWLVDRYQAFTWTQVFAGSVMLLGIIFLIVVKRLVMNRTGAGWLDKS
ncbi:hypothetical protein F53441_1169 [Fusarium austroafricanum]|uniref:Major facilitator superfamily (MFS) profile domain-containing protein n=1 Tax=Fusarium austroafricanum TaxID=2364996 RepID=A0A8H4KWR5_9HYPO|nr:hypothetical protein F53441_1169 [Fusarium austroafricanum]